MTRTVRFPTDRRQPASVPVVPVVPLRGLIPDDIDRQLSAIARDPLTETPEYRNALLTAYWPILKRICRKVWWKSSRRDLVGIEDIEQEGVLVFY